MKELTEQFWTVQHKVTKFFINLDVDPNDDERLYDSLLPDTKWSNYRAHELLTDGFNGSYGEYVADKNINNYEVVQIEASYKVK